MDKEDVVYIYTYTHIRTMEYYSAIKKNEILPFAATWMDLEDIMQSEISQREKEKYCKTSLICGIYKKQQTSEYHKKEADNRYREQSGGYQWWEQHRVSEWKGQTIGCKIG